MTNGAGMVRFSRGFMRFGKSLPIVPVALKVSVPWDIRTHTLTSNFAANLFWFCFVPLIKLEATVLKPMTLQQVVSLLLCCSTPVSYLLETASQQQQFCAARIS